MRYDVYLLEWYRSTDTDNWFITRSNSRYEVYLLYWYNSTNSDRWFPARSTALLPA
jgi:hypothetical protein